MKIINNINVPESIDELNIDQFQSIVKIYTKEYKSKIDKLVDFIAVLTNNSVDFIENLDIEVFTKIKNTINLDNLFDLGDLNFTNELIIDDIIYKTGSVDNNYTFKVKEIILLESVINKNNVFIDYLIAVIFKNVDENGNIIYDYSENAIKNRKNKLKNKVNIKIIAPFLLLLSKKLENKLANIQ